jgi:hypothetical protein
MLYLPRFFRRVKDVRNFPQSFRDERPDHLHRHNDVSHVVTQFRDPPSARSVEHPDEQRIENPLIHRGCAESLPKSCIESLSHAFPGDHLRGVSSRRKCRLGGGVKYPIAQTTIPHASMSTARTVGLGTL